MLLLGRLLVATPRLMDPNFSRTVILVLNHDKDGALGVVINRPSPMPVTQVLPTWTESVSSPKVVFGGGPVSPESALAVAVALGSGPNAGFHALAGSLGLVDLDADPGDVVPDLAGMRVFSGYAGWGAEQLEGEIAEGSWYVVEVVLGDVLSPAPETLWSEVLRRQPGELAYVATIPDDPSQN